MVMFSLLSLILACSAVALPTNRDIVPRAQPHEVEALFRRAPTNYPPPFQPPTRIPQSWLDRLHNITLPSCPRATNGNGGLNGYGGRHGGDPDICSYPYGCWAAGDLREPRPGWLALNFDDGPSGATDELYDYLVSQNATQRATHFMIGSYILNNPTAFQKIARGGGHIGVHTWSHRQTTTLSNEEIVGELGWTMQIMADLNGGRVPRFWRPPYGDVDNRVRAIARGVFGLETVVWNEDTADWNIGGDPRYSVQSVSSYYEALLQGPKTRGLNVLQHEVQSSSVQVFRNSYPKMIANRWKVGNIAEAFGMDWYQNSVGHGNTDPVASMAIGGVLLASMQPSVATSSAASTSTTSSTSATINVKSSASTETTLSTAAIPAASRVVSAAGRAREWSAVLVVGALVMMRL